MMAERTAEIHEELQEAHEKSGSKWVAVYIAILAVALAITGMGASNAMKDMLSNNIEASNLWAFFQAKTIRKTAVDATADQLGLILVANPNMPDAARKQLEDMIKRYKSASARYESEPETGEGRKELAARATEKGKARDIAQRKDPYFDFAEALIQIAIVLASVSLITRTSLLLIVSFAMSGAGIFLSANGFLLFAKLAFLEH
jgi:hypothetical protein